MFIVSHDTALSTCQSSISAWCHLVRSSSINTSTCSPVKPYPCQRCFPRLVPCTRQRGAVQISRQKAGLLLPPRMGALRRSSTEAHMLERRVQCNYCHLFQTDYPSGLPAMRDIWQGWPQAIVAPSRTRQRHVSQVPAVTSVRSGSSSWMVSVPSASRDSKRKLESSCSSTCALALYTASLKCAGSRVLSYLYRSSSFCAGQRNIGT